MGKFYNESNGESVYLVYEMSEDEKIDSVSSGMLSTNTIPGVAKTMISQIDYTKYIKFDVTSKISVDQILSRAVSKETSISLLSGITKALLASDQYLLTPDCFLLDTKYIYSNTQCTDVILICLPVEGKHGTSDLRKFFKEIFFEMKYADESDTYIGKTIGFLNSDAQFTLQKFSDFLDEIGKDKDTDRPSLPHGLNPLDPVKNSTSHNEENQDDPPVPKPEPNPRSLPTNVDYIKDKEEKEITLFYLLQHYNKDNLRIYKLQKEKKKLKKQKGTSSVSNNKPKKPAEINDDEGSMAIPPSGSDRQSDSEHVPSSGNRNNSFIAAENTGEINTIIMGNSYIDDDTTSYINSKRTVIPMLIRAKNNERIRIEKNEFRIGRDRKYSDYCINNGGIGHAHCHIVTRGKEYFIVDDNSKNHTYLDGVQLPPSTEIKLSHGQKIRLSDEEFEFRLY